MSVGTVGTVVLGTLRVCFYGFGGLGLMCHIFPSSFFTPSQRINNGELFDFTQRIVQAYEIKKEVILVAGERFAYCGNNALPGSAVLTVPTGVNLTEETKAQMKLCLAKISLNASLIVLIVPMVIAIAARYLLIDRFPTGATLAELGIGTVAVMVFDYGFQYAAWKMR